MINRLAVAIILILTLKNAFGYSTVKYDVDEIHSRKSAKLYIPRNISKNEKNYKKNYKKITLNMFLKFIYLLINNRIIR